MLGGWGRRSGSGTSIGFFGWVSGTVCMCVGGSVGDVGGPGNTVGARGSMWHGCRGLLSRPVAVVEQGQHI